MLTPEEQARLDELEREEAQAQEIIAQKSQVGGLTPEEERQLAQLEAEEMQAQQILAQKPEVDMSEEADLGLINRLKYSLEPLQSNREALLVQQFGKENVFKDPSGELFVKQRGKYIPANQPGLSMADAGEFLGAMPEAAGTAAGAFLGMGAGSIPAAMVGGAAGSAIRQALSAATGVPQVAQAGERAMEAGLSGLFAGAGSLAGKGLKQVGKKGLKKLVDVFPEYGVSKEGQKMAQIAAKEGIPEPTIGQLAGGRDLDIEKALAEKPLFGRQIRKQVNDQVDSIKKNIADVVGDFMDSESKAFDAGTTVKETASNVIDGIGKQAGQLFDEVAEEGAKISMPADQVQKELVRNFSKFGLFTREGMPRPYSPKSGMPKDQFNRLQGILGDVVESIRTAPAANQIGTPDVNANDLNVLRQMIDRSIRSGDKADYSDVVLQKVREKFMDVTENMLKTQSPETAGKFKVARELWKQKKGLEKSFTRGGQSSLKEMAPEKVAQKYMSSSKSAQELIDLVGKDNARNVGITYMNDLFQKRLGKEGQIGARAMINTLKEKKQAIIKTVGRKEYKRLMNNLFYLDKIGSPINPSRTAITQMMTDISPKALAESLGIKAIRAGRRVAKPAAQKLLKGAEKLPERAGQLGNVLGSDIQREGAYGTRRGR